MAAVMNHEATRPTVLVVEDDRSMQLVIATLLEELGYAVETASNGADAFSMLRTSGSTIDLVMTDCMMPVMDGIALTKRLKRERATQELPVVMLTGLNSPEQVSAGIAAGAFYFLPKPPDRQLVESVLQAALQDARRRAFLRSEVNLHQSGFRNMEVVRYRLSRPTEVEPVASLIASMTDEPERAIQGIFEMLQNGVEHGVLGFGFDSKVQHLRAGTWERTLRERAADPAWQSGNVEVTAVRRDGITLTFKDTGPGFNWRQFMRTDPARSGMPCGRGIARALTLSFKSLKYNETGNLAVAVIGPSETIKW